MWFYAPRGFVYPQKVLKRAKTHDRAVFVRFFVLLGNIRRTAFVRTTNELPSFKINVGVQVFFPRALHRRFERENKHAFESFFFAS